MKRYVCILCGAKTSGRGYNARFDRCKKCNNTLKTLSKTLDKISRINTHKGA